MDAIKATISDVFNNSTLVEIPFFQRSYVWEEDLWQRLIDDMEYVVKTKKAHFLGSIILKSGREPNEDDDYSSCYTVVDGQQRLTTFLIFMKALCLLQNQPDAFNSQFRINGEEIALRHGKNDIESFAKVMDMDSPQKISNNPSNNKTIAAYNYFIDHIDPQKMNFTAIKSKAQFVKITLSADENEQQIFDTINSLGVNLTTSELLKNYFFNRETLKDYEEKWEAVFEKNDEIKAYWDQQIEVGRTKRALIDIFFDAYFQIFIQNKKYNISTEDKISYSRVDKIAQSYQHFIKKYCNGDKETILEQLKQYADCFRESFRPDYCDMNISKQPSIERINILIFGLKNTTLIPYILYITKNVTDNNELMKMYHIIESYIMRRIIIHASSKNYNNIFTSVILNEILDSDKLINYFRKSNDASVYIPSNDDVIDGFNNSKLMNLQSKGILYLIESYIRNDNSAVMLLGFNQYSLEHLMPKKWRNNWKPCDSEELAKKRDMILLTLGNLAIIPLSLNTSIRDADWSTKKAGKSKNQGLKVCASGLETLIDALDKEEWNELEIESRANALSEKAIELWSI